jgi:WhiB family redox-sensing transcriptional regulator
MIEVGGTEVYTAVVAEFVRRLEAGRSIGGVAVNPFESADQEPLMAPEVPHTQVSHEQVAASSIREVVALRQSSPPMETALPLVPLGNGARFYRSVAADQAAVNDYFAQPEDDTKWYAKALCSQTDLDVFFPEKGESVRDAKKVCVECEVKQECLAEAIQNNEEYGVWGGLSERERHKLSRHRSA